MGFLVGLAAQLLEWILVKLGSAIELVWKRNVADNKIIDQADKDAQQLKDAKDAQDKADAARKLIDDTFSH